MIITKEDVRSWNLPIDLQGRIVRFIGEGKSPIEVAEAPVETTLRTCILLRPEVLGPNGVKSVLEMLMADAFGMAERWLNPCERFKNWSVAYCIGNDRTTETAASMVEFLKGECDGLYDNATSGRTMTLWADVGMRIKGLIHCARMATYFPKQPAEMLSEYYDMAGCVNLGVAGHKFTLALEYVVAELRVLEKAKPRSHGLSLNDIRMQIHR